MDAALAKMMDSTKSDDSDEETSGGNPLAQLLEASSKNPFALLGQKKKSNGRAKNDRMEKMRRGFFPVDYNDKVLVMSSRKMRTDKMRTFIFGTISARYSEDMWDYDLQMFGSRFVLNVEDSTTVHKIRMRPADQDGICLDSESAIADIHKAIDVLNSVDAGQPIRIVHLGFAESEMFFQGVEFLLKRWRPGSEHDKIVHFLTTGDTKARKYEIFCKSLILRNYCTEVEFFNCQDYFPFGEYTYSHK